jgi:Protein of unknown function (DUF2865)
MLGRQKLEEIAVVHRRCRKPAIWHTAVIAGALAGAALAPAPARAGFFDFLFGNSQDKQPGPRPESYAEPPPAGIGRVAPAPLGPESVRPGSAAGGRVIAYCVRLCDGEHFPLGHLTNATPVETCRAMCPASKTKVFYGSEIGSSVARDGAHYADLDTAFTYRKQLVANCTCNGRNAFGLAPFDVSSDPTLRPGDIVSTKDGLMAYAGKNSQGDAYTPVDPATVANELNSVTSHVAASRSNKEARADEDPGVFTAPQTASSPFNLGANMRGQIAR